MHRPSVGAGGTYCLDVSSDARIFRLRIQEAKRPPVPDQRLTPAHDRYLHGDGTVYKNSSVDEMGSRSSDT